MPTFRQVETWDGIAPLTVALHRRGFRTSFQQRPKVQQRLLSYHWDQLPTDLQTELEAELALAQTIYEKLSIEARATILALSPLFLNLRDNQVPFTFAVPFVHEERSIGYATTQAISRALAELGLRVVRLDTSLPPAQLELEKQRIKTRAFDALIFSGAFYEGWSAGEIPIQFSLGNTTYHQVYQSMNRIAGKDNSAARVLNFILHPQGFPDQSYLVSRNNLLWDRLASVIGVLNPTQLVKQKTVPLEESMNAILEHLSVSRADNSSPVLTATSPVKPMPSSPPAHSDHQPTETDLDSLGAELEIAEVVNEQFLSKEQEDALFKALVNKQKALEYQKTHPSVSNDIRLKLEKILDRGNQAKRILLQKFQPLIKSIAKRYINRSLLWEDLVQEGTLGLDAAIEQYESRGFRFASYAKWQIRAKIQQAVWDQQQQEFHRSFSLDENFQDGDTPKGDQTADPFAIDPARSHEESEPVSELRQALLTLPELDHNIIYAHYWEERTPEDIALEYQISVAQVTKTIRSVLHRLKSQIELREEP